MAIYHLSVKTIGRSEGRSATAAAAYRACCCITDEQTGEIHDYRNKSGFVSRDLILPSDAPEWAQDRQSLWNEAERAERRINSTVAREFEIALPDELNEAQRHALALDFGHALMTRHRFAVDVCIHEPSKDGDRRNHHAHILCSTRVLETGGFGAKTRELDEKTSGMVKYWRGQFAQIQNRHLRQAGHPERVDHRSLEDQGITDRAPTVHLGPRATHVQRRLQRDMRRTRQPENAAWQPPAQRRQRAVHHAQQVALQEDIRQGVAALRQQRQQALQQAHPSQRPDTDAGHRRPPKKNRDDGYSL